MIAGHANSSWDMSESDDDWSLQRNSDLYSFIINAIIVGTIVIVGVIGNSFAFVVFWKDTIKTSASFLFQSLSLIDSVLLMTIFSLYSVKSFADYTGWLHGYWAIEAYVLVCMYPTMLMAQTASVWVTVLVAVNRYIAVCLPYEASRLCTVLMAKKQLAFVLLFALLYNIPRSAECRIVYKTWDNGTTAVTAETKLGSDKLYNVIYHNVMYFIFLLALPVLILTVLNIRLIKGLKALGRKRLQMNSLRQQQDNGVTFAVIIVVVVFIICQVPTFVNLVLWNLMQSEPRLYTDFVFYMWHIANMLVAFNSAFNFVIYALFNKRIRRVLTQTVCACCALTGDRQSVKSTGRSPQKPVTNRVMTTPRKENGNTVEETRF